MAPRRAGGGAGGVGLTVPLVRCWLSEGAFVGEEVDYRPADCEDDSGDEHSVEGVLRESSVDGPLWCLGAVVGVVEDAGGAADAEGEGGE